MLEKLLKDLEKAADNTSQASTKKILQLIIDEIKRQIIKNDVDYNNNSINSTPSSCSSSCTRLSEQAKTPTSTLAAAAAALTLRTDLVEFNVGGTLITTSLATLGKRVKNPFEIGTYYEPSILEEIANGKLIPKKDKNDMFFFDRNPVYFQRILDYLRSVNTSSEERIVSSLRDITDMMIVEAKHFRLYSLIDSFGLYISRIVDAKLIETFLNMNHPFTSKDKWRLLFQAGEDGFSRETFLLKCHNKAHTLLLVKTTEGCIIGGYTDLAWDQVEKKTDAAKFLFGLVLNNNQKPFKTNTVTGNKIMNNVVYQKPGDGRICFGDNEISIEHNGNKTTESYFSVDLTEPYYHKCRIDFQVADIEVFQRAEL